MWLEQDVTRLYVQPVFACMPVDLMWLYMHCSVAVRIEYTVALAAMFARSTQGSVSTVHASVQTVCMYSQCSWCMWCNLNWSHKLMHCTCT